MNLSRRDTLRIAAAGVAARGLAPFAVSPEQARAMLAGDAAGDDAPQHWYELDPETPATADPVSFAVHLDSTDYGQFGGGFVNGAAAEWASYKHALDRVEAAAPELFGGPGLNALTDLDEEVVSMGNAMWRAGVVAGAAYEHLRLALVAPLEVCGCNGHGCATCGGTGTLAAPPTELGFWTD